MSVLSGSVYIAPQFWYKLIIVVAFGLPSAILLWRLLGAFIPQRKTRTAAIVGVTVFFVSFGLPIYIGDPNVLYFFPVFSGALLYVLQGAPLPRLTFILNFFCLAIELGAIVTAIEHARPSGILLAYAMLLVLIVLLTVGFRRLHLLPDEYPALSPKLWRVAFIMAVFSFLVLLLCIAMPIFQPYWGESPLQDAFNSFFILQSFLMTPFILLSVLVNLYVVQLLSRHEQLLQEQALSEVNRVYYDQLEQSQLEVRRLRHDLANHLQTMQQLSGDALHRYIDALIDTPAMQPRRRYCENQIVNAVLQNKSARIEQSEIQSSFSVSLPSDLPLQDIDLCALFANGLDNAIEACLVLPPDTRRLSVRACTDKGLFVLCIRNRTADCSPLQPGTLPQSTKKDRTNHGLGLRSLQEIATRYHGAMTLQRTHGMFELLITIPLPHVID